MRKIISYLIVITSFAAFSQQDLIEISGKIIDNEDSTVKIPALKVLLTFNDSLAFETIPDSIGIYSFKISKKFIEQFKIKLIASQDQQIIRKLFPPNLECPYFNNYWGYRQKRIILNPSRESKKYIVNFEMSLIRAELRSPLINFKKNSIEFCNCDIFDSDTTMFCIRKILREEPKIYIELSIHSWNENNEKQLSINRGQYVIKRLYDLGVDTSRVKIKTWGSTKPLLKQEYIEREKSLEEKEKLACKNRRAVMKALWIE